MNKSNLIFFFNLLLVYVGFAQINFENEATALGLSTTCGATQYGNGISFCDFDNDGWDDITTATDIGQPIRFFKNSNGVFVEQNFNISDTNDVVKQVIWVDVDNDGDKDIYKTSNSVGNKLYENDGYFNFTDITLSSGLPTTNMFSYGASWGDIDNDGLLDVFICNRSESFPNKLYKNNGNNVFIDVSDSAGISLLGHMSFCSAFFDFNNDGWQDIYISNDKYDHANIMYKNNGNGTFSDVSVSTQTNVSIDAMTTTIGDFNNDGWFDIYVTNTSNGNVLFRNNGDETFTNIATSSGTIFNSIGWGAVFLDAENDMDLDLYVSGSTIGPNPNYISAAFYENQNDETFLLQSNAGFINDNRSSYSNAIGDVDNDGFPEIVVSNNYNEDIFLWKNNTVSDNNWLKVKLQGVVSNTDGIGSVIEVSVNGNSQYNYTLCGEGFLSQNTNTEFFGLSNNTNVDYVKVTWLSGAVDIIYNVTSNQTLLIVEGNYPLSVNSEPVNNFTFYPNPVKNKLHFNSTFPVTKVTLFNMLGQKINSIDFNYSDINIDLSAFISGVYFAKVEVNGRIKTFRFIKN